MPVVYGFETWSVTLKEGRRLRVLKILRTNRDKVRGEWRRLHNWELHDLYSSPHCLVDQIKQNVIGWACCMHEVQKICMQDFGGET
jgi:hypothetical protein